MQLNHAKALAQSLVLQHLGLNWNFEFDRAKRRFGKCSHAHKTITLSKYLTELNSENEVLDTILHEIAHALAGPSHGHDNTWKSICVRIGARPERCYNSDTINKPVARIKLVCPNGHVSNRYRKPRKVYACRICCNAHNNGKFDAAYKFEVIAVE